MHMSTRMRPTDGSAETPGQDLDGASVAQGALVSGQEPARPAVTLPELARPAVAAARRWVVKLGTGVLTEADGQLARHRLRHHLGALATLWHRGHQVVLVSSGAVGLGRHLLGLEPKALDVQLRQSCAAIGQTKLMSFYEQELSRHGVVCGQVLLNQGDFDDRQRCLGLRQALQAMLANGVIPILNENDAVAAERLAQGVVERLIFSDNDRLAALVANELSCDLLLLLTDVDGVFDRDPRRHAEASLLSRVDDLAELGEISAEPGTRGGRGGMGSKVAAAAVARAGGCQAVIANGHHRAVVQRVGAGEEVGTWLPAGQALSSRCRWIAFATAPRGVLHLDQGAVEALCLRHASLLPVGVVRVEGHFQRGDVVVMLGPSGETVGRGLALYDAETMRGLCGARLFNDRLSAEQKGPNALLRRTHVVLETKREGARSNTETPESYPESSSSLDPGTAQEAIP